MDEVKESQVITDIRLICTEKTNDSRRLEQQREAERERRSRDICHACFLRLFRAAAGGKESSVKPERYGLVSVCGSGSC